MEIRKRRICTGPKGEGYTSENRGKLDQEVLGEKQQKLHLPISHFPFSSGKCTIAQEVQHHYYVFAFCRWKCIPVLNLLIAGSSFSPSYSATLGAGLWGFLSPDLKKIPLSLSSIWHYLKHLPRRLNESEAASQLDQAPGQEIKPLSC